MRKTVIGHGPIIEQQRKKFRRLVALSLEICIKFFFSNFLYTFGGECYLQGYGGPIGARLTMAVSRLVMQAWYEKYKEILDNSHIEELLKGIYVDDGRTVARKLMLGTRYNEIEKIFEINEENRDIDEREGITREKLTEREFKKLMNSINSDLEFTTESERDFDNKRLPTLSFEMWSTSEGISHSYFEKHMRSQVLTMRRSSMPETSKYSILVNELNRRFEVMSEDVTVEERVNTVDKFTQQLVNSGFSYTQIKDIVLSSLKGEKKKEIKRKTKGGKRYLSSSETLQDRINKKLTEAVAWYREELRKEEREEIENDDMKREKGSWASWRKYKRKKKKPKVEKKGGKVDNGEEKIEYKTVIFIQHTYESSLAKRIREKLEKLEEAGGNIKIKIVERAGDKIVDLLHRSNPWDNIDCMRNDCLLCSTAGEKGRKGVCRRRNIVYETFCMNCGEVGEEDRGDTVNENIKLEDENEALEEMVEGSHDKIEKISENENPEGEKLMKKRDYKYKYIGETCRSGYERGKEHLMMKENCNESSHMLKHCLLQHSDKDPMEIKFGMRVRQQFKTALERQVGEAVAILEERERGIQLLNSKSEFNRCSLPRITAGNTKEWLERLQEEDAAEKKVKASIREMKKRKKREKKEKSPTLEEVCDEIIGENKERWKEGN